MKRIAIGVVVGLLVGVTSAEAAENRPAWQGARMAALDYIAPLVRPNTQPVRVRVRDCVDNGYWTTCDVVVAGTSTCHAEIRVHTRGREYAAWVPRMRCR